jgi:Fe-S-cluster containining protein
MGEFVCTMCGRCCMGMGKYVKIVGSTGPNKVICQHELGKETCYATIEKPYRDDFDHEEDMETLTQWCPFLKRTNDEERYVCIIYQTRPRFCREFKCARMRIYDRENNEIGILKGRRTLSSDNKNLKELWEQKVSPLFMDDDTKWKETVKKILQDEEYLVEIYD